MIQEQVQTSQSHPAKNGEEHPSDPSEFVRPPDRMTWLSLDLPPMHSEITAVFGEAIAEAAKLPVEDQNYIAFRIMEEIAEEKKWTDSFARSPDVLAKVAAEALQEHAEGRTQPLEEIL